jgi:hypothetical protein
MLKVLRALGIIAMPTSFIFILGTIGSADLNLLSFDQIVIRCLVALVVGAVGFAVVWITDNMPKSKPNTVTALTPEQLYTKCCYCPHYKTCTKSYEEVIEC